MASEPLVSHIYTAVPSAHVFEGKIYVYPSHVSLSNPRDSKLQEQRIDVTDMERYRPPWMPFGQIPMTRVF